MAARRLVALLIALLVISSIATALAPRQGSDEETDSTSTTTTTPETDPQGPEAAVVEAVIDTTVKETDPVEAAVGDQLALAVRSDTTTEVGIPKLGLLETAAPGAPAVFDVVLREAGTLQVTSNGRPAGEIVVGRPGGDAAKPKKEAEKNVDRAAGEDQQRAPARRESGSSVAA